MLLSAVSVLVVAQSSSEIPEGLMNNPVQVCLPAPLCWVTHDCVWCWWSATTVLVHALAHHMQSHKTISTPVERIPHLHHTQAQSVCGCAYVLCFVPTGNGYQCTTLPGPVTQLTCHFPTDTALVWHFLHCWRFLTLCGGNMHQHITKDQPATIFCFTGIQEENRNSTVHHFDGM